jgi:hypothetical protein
MNCNDEEREMWRVPDVSPAQFEHDAPPEGTRFQPDPGGPPRLGS